MNNKANMKPPPFTIVIPARYDSTRLAGKVLIDIHGKPMVQHVYEKARQSQAKEIFIATDSDNVFQVAKNFGASVHMTSNTHRSGSLRVAELVANLALADDTIIVTLQGDEPLINPLLIDQVAMLLDAEKDADSATLCDHLTSVDDYHNPNCVKVVLNQRGFAMYFSRSPLPWIKDEELRANGLNSDSGVYRHIGVYAYRVGFLKRYTNLAPAPLENYESLEQLRILWHGHSSRVALACGKTYPGVDTPQDLARVREFLQQKVMSS